MNLFQRYFFPDCYLAISIKDYLNERKNIPKTKPYKNRISCIGEIGDSIIAVGNVNLESINPLTEEYEIRDLTGDLRLMLNLTNIFLYDRELDYKKLKENQGRYSMVLFLHNSNNRMPNLYYVLREPQTASSRSFLEFESLKSAFATV